MSLQDVRNMYEDKVSTIFPTTDGWVWEKLESVVFWPWRKVKGAGSWLWAKEKGGENEMKEEEENNEEKVDKGWGKLRVLGMPYPPYSQDGLEKVLREKFGAEATLRSVQRDPNKAIAAAVARRHHPDMLDQLEIFDTEGGRSYKLVEVLKASACAPVYFETPTKIDDISYIDGGVGGNCPLAQAIPRMGEIMGPDVELQVVISIAPSAETDMKDQKTVFQWLPWFPSQLTDGFAAYHDQQKSNPGPIFLRLAPTSEEARAFKMDSLDVAGMIASVR